MSWWCHRLTILHVFYIFIQFWKFQFFAQTCKCMSPYQNVLEQTLFCIYSEWIQGKFYFLIAEIWDFRHFCEQNTWKIVRRWHHQCTHLHIHIDRSRNVSLKIMGIKNFISSLYFLPIYINFSLFCSIFFYSFYTLNLNLDRISPLRIFIWYCRHLNHFHIGSIWMRVFTHNSQI